MTKNLDRISVVVAAISIQLCLGTAYIWSIFQNGIAEKIFAGDNASASLTFSLLLATLTIGSTLGGKMQSRYSPRVIVIIGGFILTAGFFLASFVTSELPWLLWITYGVMGGIGMGFTYSTTIACAQKWYPDKKGFITGVIVSALGFGGVVFTPFVEFLIGYFGGPGAGELMTFRVLSVVFAIVCTVGGLFVKNPAPSDFSKEIALNKNNASSSSKDFSPKQILKTPQFYLLTIAMMLACMGGLMMIGFAKPIAISKGMAETATIGVLTIALFNSFGRIFWGGISDKLGRKKTLIILLLGTSILSLLVNFSYGYSIYVLIGFIGFFYGGFLSNFPAYTADLFGSKHMATNYGMVMVGFGLGAVSASYIAGYFKNIAANDISLMFPAFAISSVAALLGIILVYIIKKPLL